MTEHEFWLSVRRRRRLFFLWWIGWMPFGLIAMSSLSSLFPGGGNMIPWVVLLAWLISWGYIARSITRLTCPRLRPT